MALTDLGAQIYKAHAIQGCKPIHRLLRYKKCFTAGMDLLYMKDH